MFDLELRFLSVTDEDSFRSAVAEFARTDPDFDFAFRFNDQTIFAEYVELVRAWSEGQRLPDTFVPNSYFVAVLDGKIIGRVSLRHRLTDYLLNFGGHVGYGVISSQRNHGYATRMLRAVLPKALELGIERVLVTCDENNTASRRVIEKCGGILENIVPEPDKNVNKMRYWISCNI